MIRRDIRSFAVPEEGSCLNDPSWWYDEGENHRVEDGDIVRDLPTSVWAVTFESPEAIARFVDANYPVAMKRITYQSPVWADTRDPVYELVLYDTGRAI